MKKLLRSGIGTAVAVSALLGGSAQAQIIDDFNTPGLGQYTLTILNDVAIAEANVSFSDTAGSLSASYGGTLSQPEQLVFLRSDLNLVVGKMLYVDVLFPTDTDTMDFGLAVGSTATPTAASIGDTDTRDTFNWAAVYVRPSQDAVRNTSVINGTIVTATGIASAVETTVTGLFIERTSTTGFTLGYFDGGGRHDTRSIVFTANDVGTAIGFYGDLRAVGGNLGVLDNLALIPEPSSAALLGIGGLAFLLRFRRRS